MIKIFKKIKELNNILILDSEEQKTDLILKQININNYISSGFIGDFISPLNVKIKEIVLNYNNIYNNHSIVIRKNNIIIHTINIIDWVITHQPISNEINKWDNITVHVNWIENFLWYWLNLSFIY